MKDDSRATNSEPPDGARAAPLTRFDALAFGLTTVAALVVYLRRLAPTVTLEDSGELAVAADHLGVPHPPGYPGWTKLAWFFQWIFDGASYHGNPNPAWAIGLCSAVCAALTCGIAALLVKPRRTPPGAGPERGRGP